MTERYHAMGDSIKASEARLTEIAVLKAHICKAKEEMQELRRARRNVELFFAEEKSSTEKTKSR